MPMTRIAILILGLTVLIAPAAVSASHYYLEDIADVFSEDELVVFDRFGIQDTEHLLLWLVTPDDRIAFSTSTGMSLQELEDLARLCELMQVEGVGPRAARLLIATGISSVSDLQGRHAETLTAELQTVNYTEQITSVAPSLDHVNAWIYASMGVEVYVQY